MGAQRNSGRVAQPPDLVRSQPLKVMLRPGQYADLDAVAEGWGVPIGTAAWAILAEQLAKWRGSAPDLGLVGMKRAATAHALTQAGLE